MKKGFFKLLTVFVFAFLLVVNAEIASASTQISNGFAIIEATLISPENYDPLTSVTYTLSIINNDGTRRGEIVTFPNGVFPDNILIDSNGNFIATEQPGYLSRITPEGLRTVIYTFPSGTWPHQTAIDKDGNFIVCEPASDTLSKITPNGIRTVIYKFSQGSSPLGLAIDENGDYFVTEAGQEFDPNNLPKLVKIANDGTRTVIYNFSPGTFPIFIAIDRNGDIIVNEKIPGKTARVTPGGVYTELTDTNDLTKVVDLYPYIFPAGLDLDNNGNIIIAVGMAGSIFRLTSDGVRTEIYHSDMPMPVLVATLPQNEIVPIDISFSSSINRKSKGNVPVAIISSSTFDATTIDRSTVVFAGASPLSIGQGFEDVNGDGLPDVVLHFKTQDLNLQLNSTEACLTGKTLSGQEFKGCDSVRVVK